MSLYSLYQLILRTQDLDHPEQLDRTLQFQMSTLAVFCSSLIQF
jgi:hypothetical protein